MASYLRLTGGYPVSVSIYEADEECLGHLNGSLDAVESLLKKEPAKHFLTREPLSAAEEYAQAVGWKQLKGEKCIRCGRVGCVYCPNWA